jgi:hypothetical protein
VWYGTSSQLSTQWWQYSCSKELRLTRWQPTRRARPISLPVEPLCAKCIQPRFVVGPPRISHVFTPARILSSHLLFTTRALFAERWTPLRSPAMTYFFSISFSTATYSLLLSAFVCMVAHPCGVKSHGSALLASVCISSHQSARASWLTWLVRLDPCHSREPLAYMHHDSCARASVLAMLILCYSACLC